MQFMAFERVGAMIFPVFISTTIRTMIAPSKYSHFLILTGYQNENSRMGEP